MFDCTIGEMKRRAMNLNKILNDYCILIMRISVGTNEREVKKEWEYENGREESKKWFWFFIFIKAGVVFISNTLDLLALCPYSLYYQIASFGLKSKKDQNNFITLFISINGGQQMRESDLMTLNYIFFFKLVNQPFLAIIF